ncbi:MAG: hypothetical protein AB8B95_10500 [Pseudohongiellaceae bacterium]
MSTSGSIESNRAVKLFAVLTALFALLFFASSNNELLKQYVLTESAEQSLIGEADCRADELLEEGLSVRECQLMRIQLEIVYESSPDWFRSAQILLNAMAMVSAVGVIALVTFRPLRARSQLLLVVLILFVVIDALSFLAALQTGPLLRAQYLWPTLLWFFIHLSSVIVYRFIVEDDAVDTRLGNQNL